MNEKPSLIVVMGVSGCGKSTVANAIAKQLGYEFVEADDFHPQENKDYMASGQALSDNMRQPWIALLQSYLRQAANAKRSCVMSFSGLRRAHREKIRELSFKCVFIHLAGEQKVIIDRIRQRSNHFMPASLLDSQYAALESPAEEENIASIDIDQSIELVTSDAIAAINHYAKQ